ncbi:DUF1176 domain-containing protein [Sphingomonas sp. PAMC 26605]|uniref:DUF1176 domain-containing protein n=1 Tax=Sphingomonas sp. PAMC 26605 TaxID=1112214 RepID=UPI0009DADCDE|nr:DUF1176 domain-containing protein [Sphingomonas sp. PAMC 26605]
MFALLLTLTAAPEASVRRFGDWFVACDNGLACVAGSLRSDDDDATAVFMLHQAATATATPEIAVQLPQGTATPVQFLVDGTPLILDPSRTEDRLVFSSEDAKRLLAIMHKGDKFTLADRAGKPLATASLAGAAAVLLAIDDAQHRIGTIVALLRRGPNPAREIPLPPLLPRIAAVKSSRREGPALPPARIASLRAEAGCDGTDADAQTYPLDEQRRLVLIACDGGAYNFTSLAVTVDRAGRTADAPVDRQDADDDGSKLVNSSYNGGVLSTFVKGRGPGDCGHSRRYVWDGRRFVTIEVARQDECGGNPDWPVLYRAIPFWRHG